MTIYHAQVSLNRATALPEDVVTNTFHFGSTEAHDDDNGALIAGMLWTFYNAAVSGGDTVCSYFSNLLTGAGRLRITTEEDPTPRVPWYDEAFGITPGGDDPLPEEVAACVSFQAFPISGAIQARRRGRVFLGPLNERARGIANGRTRVSAGLRLTAAKSARRLAVSATPGLYWGVFSPTTGGIILVEEGWVDDAFDTVRSRGGASTSRQLFDPAAPV